MKMPKDDVLCDLLNLVASSSSKEMTATYREQKKEKSETSYLMSFIGSQLGTTLDPSFPQLESPKVKGNPFGS